VDADAFIANQIAIIADTHIIDPFYKGQVFAGRP
jgi:hypothetical protein